MALVCTEKGKHAEDISEEMLVTLQEEIEDETYALLTSQALYAHAAAGPEYA